MAYPTVSAGYGFLPVNLTGGLPFSGSTRYMSIASGYAANIFFGDPVKITAGTIVKSTGTTADTFVGIFLGVTYTDPNLKYKLFRQYWPTGTVAADAKAIVDYNPDSVFKVLLTNAGTVYTASAATVANIMRNMAMVQTAGSATTGNSAISLDLSTSATTNTLPFKVIDLVEDTKLSDGTYVEALCRYNFGMHQYWAALGV